jgi:hypothetical protein
LGFSGYISFFLWKHLVLRSLGCQVKIHPPEWLAGDQRSAALKPWVET